MGGVSNPAALPTFYELDGSHAHQVSAASSWEDWDISAIIPEGVTRVLMRLSMAAPAGCTAGLRENGSAAARSFTYQGYAFSLESKVDAARIIECYDSTAGHAVLFALWGYWG